jgi:hypothetical protein
MERFCSLWPIAGTCNFQLGSLSESPNPAASVGYFILSRPPAFRQRQIYQ